MLTPAIFWLALFFDIPCLRFIYINGLEPPTPGVEGEPSALGGGMEGRLQCIVVKGKAVFV